MAEDLKTEKTVDTVTLTIDSQSITVPKGTTVLEAARGMGIHIPTFCWHPKLKSVGACRMCYVEVEKMPKLQVSCMLDAMDGMVVYTNSNQVKQGRKAIIEFILMNHPLDCPTCDKGGECELQNLTFAHGIDDTRFDFTKFRFRDDEMDTTFDDKKIGPEIVLNRNRCILCYKCVRANKQAFGEYDLGAYERGNITEINSAPGEEVDNPFSGNLVEICPVGALTNSDWRYKIRVWLTKTTPSICNFTSSGTNILFYKEDHKNKIYRVTSNRNDNIDDGWLSDITRYGYQIVNAPDRLTKPLIKKDGIQVEATWEEALEVIRTRCGEIKEKMGGVCIGGLVSPSLDNRSLYSFSKMMRKVFKSNNLDFRGDYRLLPENPNSPFGVLRSQPFKIADIDKSDIIISFGSDLIREHPNEYLRVRKAYNFNNSTIYSFSPYAVKSADVATGEFVYNPGTEEMAIHALCLAGIELGLVDASLASDYKTKTKPASLAEAVKLCGLEVDSLKQCAKKIADGKKITFIIGEIVTRSKARDAISTALINLNNLFGVSGKGQIAILARYANSKGAEKLGILPQPLDEIKRNLKDLWGEYPEAVPKNTDAMMALIKKEEIKGLFIFGSNPMMLYPDHEFVKEGLEKIDFLVACDLFETATTELADVVLPLASWAEYEGDYVNLEGCNQTAQKAVKPIGKSKPVYEIVELIANKFENSLYKNEGEARSEINKILAIDTVQPIPSGINEFNFELDEVVEDGTVPVFVVDDPHHCGHLTEKAASLINFASEPYVEISPELAGKLKIKNNDPVRLESEIARVVVPVKISEVLEKDVVLVPRNFTAKKVTSIFMRKRRVDRIKITRVDE